MMPHLRHALRALCLAVPLSALLSACGGSRAGVGGAAAPGSTTCAAPHAAAPDLPDDAAIGIVATVRAKSLRFEDEPRTSVAVRGDTAAAERSCDTRVGLPRPVRAGQTYRDVEVRWRLAVPLDTTRLPADSVRPRR